MKKLSLFCLGALSCLGPLASTATQTPPGSYQLSCHGITAADDALSATCKKLDGTTQKTQLSGLSACMASIANNGDIGNIDGHLLCIPDLPQSAPAMKFPEAETTVNRWIYEGDLASAYRHGWGLWAGLTRVMGQVDGQPVRAFETWATLSNMLYRMDVSEAKAGAKTRLDLSEPRQFRNVKDTAPAQQKKLNAETSSDGDTQIFVSVAYNPPAAKHAITNKLFLQSTLDRLLQDGYTEIPNFPANAVIIKPVYKIIPQNTPGGIYTFFLDGQARPIRRSRLASRAGMPASMWISTAPAPAARRLIKAARAERPTTPFM